SVIRRSPPCFQRKSLGAGRWGFHKLCTFCALLLSAATQHSNSTGRTTPAWRRQAGGLHSILENRCCSRHFSHHFLRDSRTVGCLQTVDFGRASPLAMSYTCTQRARSCARGILSV